MIDDYTIVNAVVHAYNFAASNEAFDFSEVFTEANYGFHTTISPKDDFSLTREEFKREWSIEDLAHLLFVESGIDFAFYQALPLTDFYKDGLVSVSKGAEMARRWPDRVRWYATVNPFEGAKALRELEHQVTELGASALKIYPAQYQNGTTWRLRLDDHKIMFPVFEKAQELGLTSIAVHKAQPVGPTAIDAFRVDDVDEACAAFPDLNFEIVHTGWSFLEDSCLQLARHDNLYANLEVTFSWVVTRPRHFLHVLGELLHWGGPDKILYGDGCTLCHPLPGLRAFADIEMPEDLIEGYGYPELTPEIKQKILAGNVARLHGLDLTEVTQRVRDDEFSRARAERDAGARPWTPVRPAVTAAADA